MRGIENKKCLKCAKVPRVPKVENVQDWGDREDSIVFQIIKSEAGPKFNQENELHGGISPATQPEGVKP